MIETPTTVNLTGMASRGAGKGAETVVTVAGLTAGRGSSRKAATDAAAREVAGWLDNITREAALVREPDGSLWFIWPDREGHVSRRVNPDGIASNCTSLGRGTPSEAAESLVKHHEGAVRVF